MAFSYETRPTDLATIAATELDVLIIGGGITGAGVAVQAAAAGLKTGLIEMQDFAEGTSSRSTKLVHGGIRYLKQFDVEVVADTVQERAVVQQIAPHIPRADPMLLPIYDEPNSTFNMFSVKIAMDLYDRLANVTGKYANYMLTKDEVLAREPQLKKDGLKGGGVYLDFRNNDARLVIENIKQAHADGGIMLSHVKAKEITHNEEGLVNGVIAEDLLTNRELVIRAKIVINTGGPWSDLVRKLDHAIEVIPQMRPTKGVHLVVDRERLSVPQPTYFDTGKGDGRMVFVIPREEKTYFGTTDTDYRGDYSQPTVEQADVDYLLEIVNNRYPEANLSLADIEGSWAGLRPLISDNRSSDYNGGNSGKISEQGFEDLITIVTKYNQGKVERSDVEDVIQHLEDTLSEKGDSPSAVSRGSDLGIAPDGLLTLAGGKITDYRKMAAGAMQKVKEILEQDFGQSVNLIDSKTYPVSGGHFDPTKVDDILEEYAQQGVDKGLSLEDARYLANLYGSNVLAIFDKIADTTAIEGLSLANTLSLRYALEEEAVFRAVDFFTRRTNYLLFMNDKMEPLIEPTLAYMASYLDWDETTTEHQRATLLAALDETRLTHLKSR